METKWDSIQYLKFEEQRNQPAKDLISKLVGFRPESIADLGCGPGNSTALLKQAFPDAAITGIDSSEDMVLKAQRNYHELTFVKKDLCKLKGQNDLLAR